MAILPSSAVASVRPGSLPASPPLYCACPGPEQPKPRHRISRCKPKPRRLRSTRACGGAGQRWQHGNPLVGHSGPQPRRLVRIGLGSSGARRGGGRLPIRPLRERDGPPGLGFNQPGLGDAAAPGQPRPTVAQDRRVPFPVAPDDASAAGEHHERPEFYGSAGVRRGLLPTAGR